MSAEKLLIIKLGSIGDVVHALPAASLMRRLFPDAVIDWLIEPKSAPILYGNPNLSSIIEVDTKLWRGEVLRSPIAVASDTCRMASGLKKSRYDATIDLQGLIKSGAFAWVSKASCRFGFPARECREVLNALSTNYKCWHVLDATHIIEKLCAVVWAVGEEFGRVKPKDDLNWCDGVDSDIYVSADCRLRFADFLMVKGVGEQDVLVAVNPCAGWITKQWSTRNFAKMLRILLDTDLPRQPYFMLLHGPGEEPHAREVLSYLKGNDNRVFMAPRSDIPMLCAMLDRCDLVVSGDTAILHIAAALHRPTVELFGPSDPARNGAFGNRSITIQHSMACGPCYKRECDSMACIRNISPQTVAAAVLKLLFV
ncbi:glycosyltransferase family 9 protein [bacterium]|nr:glycosyltransferase family 9 protein [bacterium]